MKKIMMILLSAVLICSMGFPAFAAETDSPTTEKITTANAMTGTDDGHKHSWVYVKTDVHIVEDTTRGNQLNYYIDTYRCSICSKTKTKKTIF